MIYKLQIQKNGDSFSAIFPKKMIADLHLEEDSEIFAIPTDQGMLLAKHSEIFFDGMSAFELGRKKYRIALSELAKK